MIVFTHLLNDHTGSPRVLRSVIDAMEEDAILFIGSDGRGILEQTAVPKRRYWYRHTPWRLATLLTYFVSQVMLLRALMTTRGLPRDAVVYINTLLPFAAAIWGHITGRPVVYHLHEMSLSPPAFQRLLVGIAQRTATRLVYVSHAHATLLPIDTARATTIPNIVDPQLTRAGVASGYRHRQNGLFVVTMLASARAYKGTGEFMTLATALAHRRDIVFRLVSDTDADLLSGRAPLPNVRLLPQIDDPAGYYEESSLVLNLSRPDLCVETFGLTLLEAMTFGIPVIAPPVGGPAELVEPDRSGYLIDSRDTMALAAAVERLADDETLCLAMSDAARERAARHDAAHFRTAIADVIESVRG